jgi:hypothetical protein
VQLVRRDPRRISMVGVVPHAMGPSDERLDLTLDERSDELDARKLFLGCGSKLLDPLH